MSAILVGIDVGTSGLKALALEAESGRVVASAERPYPLSTPATGWSEQEADDWVEALVAALGELSRALGKRASWVTSIGLTGQMHTALMLDEQHRPLRPAMLWNDTRTRAECVEIVERVGLRTLGAEVRNRPLEGFTLPKLMWLKKHEPDVLSRARHVLLPKDFVGLVLTGELGTEPSDASGTLAFDPERRHYSEAVLRACGVPRGLFADVGESASLLGSLREELATRVGLRPGLPVARGAADNAAAAVGLGVTAPGRAMVSIGTSGVVLAPVSSLPSGASTVASGLHAFCHAHPERSYLMGVMLSAGGALRWYRDVLCDGERIGAELRGADPYEIITEAASTSRPGAGGLVFLPYLAGERTPHADPDARGALVGLSLRSTKADVSRAVLEGITFGFADLLELVALGTPDGEQPDELRVTGGGAKSAFWRGLMADVLGAPVVTTSSTEGAAFGAALLGGVATGAFDDVDQAAACTVRATGERAPDPSTSQRYAELRAAYRSLYPALSPAFSTLARL
jgi:xylulokinase